MTTAIARDEIKRLVGLNSLQHRSALPRIVGKIGKENIASLNIRATVVIVGFVGVGNDLSKDVEALLADVLWRFVDGGSQAVMRGSNLEVSQLRTFRPAPGSRSWLPPRGVALEALGVVEAVTSKVTAPKLVSPVGKFGNEST